MQIVKLKIKDLTPYYKNAKKHTEEQINHVIESIKRFQFCDPIGVWGEKNIIVEGHCRVLALKKMGVKEVECIRLDHLTDEERKAYTLVHNQSTLETPFELDLLSEELASITDIDMSELGFDIEDIRIEEHTEIEEDEAPSVDEVESRCKLGDIWQLGEHRLMCGSALAVEDVKKLLDGAICELTFTDPPYQLETQGGGIMKKANRMKQIKENGVDSFDPSQLILFSETNIYCHNKPLIKKYIELAENNNKAYDLCFYKKLCTVPNYKGHLMTDCEYIAVIGKQDPNKGLDKEMYSKCYIGKKDADNELSYSKPIELCVKFIKLYGKQNILDLFGGSGSTLIACEQLKRRCYMMELDTKYCDVIIARWEKFTGKKAVKVEV